MADRKMQRDDRKIYGVYLQSVLTMKVIVAITSVGKNMKQNLERIISKKTEGKCIAEGFIRPNSVKVIRYSSGTINNENIEFQTVFECMVCHPVEGMLIECDTKTITKAGIHAEVTDESTAFFIVQGALNATKATVDGRNITEYSIRLSRLTPCTSDLNINRVNLVGRLGADPEYRTFESGSQKCHFSLAIDAGKDENGNKRTQWFNRVTFWGREAEVISTYVKKGDQLIVQGYFRPSHFESNGNQVDMLEFHCNEFSFGAKNPIKTNGATTHSDADTHPALVGADDEIPGDWG
jgi:single stranded DNA-binding protein